MKRVFVVAVLWSAAAAAQQPIFAPDDFVEPSLHEQPVFTANVSAGIGRGLADHYRTREGNASLVHLAANLYWSNFQIGYERTESRAQGRTEPDVYECRCPDLVYFPTPPLANEAPAAPPDGSRDTVQFALYQGTRRYRVRVERQPLRTDVRSLTTGEVVSRLRGEDLSVTIDGDLHRLGFLSIARTTTTGTTRERAQNVVSYTQRFAITQVREIFIRPTLTVGSITNRGGTAINLVQPAVELLWHVPRKDVNLHLVMSPYVSRNGNGWRVDPQLALFADYTFFVHIFGGTSPR